MPQRRGAKVSAEKFMAKYFQSV